MADVMVHVDGFDYYTSVEAGRRYDTGSLNSFVSGRFSGQAAQYTSSGAIIEKIHTASQSWLIGFALNLQSQTGSTYSLINLKDGASGQCGLSWIATTRNFQFNRNGTLIGSAGSTGLNTGVWYWIEVYFTIKDSISSGECVLKINGVTDLTLAAASDTKNTSNTTADRWNISGAAFWSFYVDDLFVKTMDTTTTPTFLGERRVITLYPSGNGNYSAFAGSDGNSVNNYQLVDDTTTNDSDYVQSATVNDKDSYAMGDFSPNPASITALQICSQMKKDDAGAKTARLFSRISSTDYESGDKTPASTFNIFTHLMETSPATSSAWTASEVNGMEAGVKVQA